MLATLFMAGIYIHIPFCTKACHYCNFHFSTQTEHIQTFVDALLKEIKMQAGYLQAPIHTLYFGGGTPSLLTKHQLQQIIETLHQHFNIATDAEFTLEANPDDLDATKLVDWGALGINRLSIGIQSFQAPALQWMNRAHTVDQSHQAIVLAKAAGFDNMSIDLIYGSPSLSDEALMSDLDWIEKYEIKHVSCYALTVEDKTALKKLIAAKKIEDVDPEKQARHFEILSARLKQMGMEHYEISNFAQPGFRSKHNSHYWEGVPYLGLGPSAHSFNEVSRQWNIANNALYIQSVTNNLVPFEIEYLSPTTRYNEYMMTSLRRMEGFDLDYITDKFGREIYQDCIQTIASMQDKHYLVQTPKGYTLSQEARFLADGIASDFFILGSAQ